MPFIDAATVSGSPWGAPSSRWLATTMFRATNGRWFRFRLRTMFVVFTVFAAWLGWNVHVVRQRTAKLTELESADFRVVVSTRAEQEALYNTSNKRMPQISYIRRLLGDEPVYRIKFFNPWLSDAEFNETAELFPEATVGAFFRKDRKPTQ